MERKDVGAEVWEPELGIAFTDVEEPMRELEMSLLTTIVGFHGSSKGLIVSTNGKEGHLEQVGVGCPKISLPNERRSASKGLV
ncbi:hypothetical protein MLD38_035454 [Melastoma candidum]|uniref:Uncharacterized protein n=1 Tax=Melastoma candidum TaxID=119954 RepID=A0ACB9LHL3_9MYRT|nr:hypothetical protein MLD38_035454 [Melastoma candidum]